MKVAILGPIVKDHITIDEDTKTQVGGIPYYAGNVFSHLGAETTVFVTYAKEDDQWFRNNFTDAVIEHVQVQKTLEFSRTYNSKNPDKCQSIEIIYSPNVILATDNLLAKLESFDYIVLSPLFYDNLPVELFKKLKVDYNKKVVHGNFGMFTYAIGNKLVQQHSENLISVADYIDYLFLDENEIMFVGQRDTVEESVKVIQDKGTSVIIATNGSKGSRIFTRNSIFKISAYPPKQIVDPTGAGDTYLAAFIRSLELFDDYEKSGQFAAMTATISLEQRGSFSGSLEEVYKRLGWGQS
jgi:sugar/nucleoside kinase (ribokinase family)